VVQTLYQNIGGEQGISKMVHYFYNELLLKDESVNHFFKSTDMEKQMAHLAKFIGVALGGPHNYSGKSMAKAHEEMDLQPEHFDVFTNHLNDALAHFGVEEEVINLALKKVAEFKDGIMYR
jgi:hemoglobin